jgi:3-isopropylmalate/(R)-2-methylmalate dehydratase large subunit
MAEKIFSRKNKHGKTVEAGEFVDARIDGAMLCLPFDEVHRHLVKAGMAQGLPSVWDREKVYYIMDHFQPAPNMEIAERNRRGREIAARLNLKYVHDSCPGVGHQVMCDLGYVRPGELIPGIDSHSTLYGALNAAGTGIGEADMAYALLFGELWFQVPASIKIELQGRGRPYPFAKDILLYLAGLYGDDFAQYRSLEFTGSAADAMTLSDRMCLADHAVEVGAKFGLFKADAKVIEYVKARTNRPFEAVEADPDAVYERIITVDTDSLDFYAAKPHSFGNVCPIREAAGVKIDQAVIGSCANGRFEDIEAAAKILDGKKTASHTRFLIQPASWAVYRQCVEAGLVPRLLDAGVQFLTPGCGICQPVLGCLAAGETCITAATRNYKGRLGSPDADIYLAGPVTVAASALAGEIVDPGELAYACF